MTAPTTTVPAAPVGRTGLLHRPLWLLGGQLGVIVIVFVGFGVRTGVKPKIAAALLVMAIAGTIAFGPVSRLGRIVVTGPVVGVLTWWIGSYVWTSNVFGWWTDTQLTMPYVLAAVVLVGLLPEREFRAALVVGCYLAIGYTVLELAVHPGRATVNPDGVSGWRGGFLHKNAMGPFMVFATLVIASFDRPSWRRRLTIALCVTLAVLSQSTTALGAGLVTLVVCAFVRALAGGTRPARASLAMAATSVVVLGVVLSSSAFPALLGLSGEDSTLSRRTDVWAGVVDAIERRPWQGYGIGGVWSDPSSEPGRSIMRELGFTVFHSHNGFLEVLLVLGVVGLALVVWLIVSTVGLGFTTLRTDTDAAVFAIGLVVLMVMLSISEVALLGVWLGLLCACHCWLTRIDSRRRLGLPHLVE